MDRMYIEVSSEIHHRIENMAALHGMSCNDFMISRAIMDIPNTATLAAINELSSGGGDKYSSFGNFLTEASDAQ